MDDENDTWMTPNWFRDKSNVWRAGNVNALLEMVWRTLPEMLRVFNEGNPVANIIHILQAVFRTDILPTVNYKAKQYLNKSFAKHFCMKMLLVKCRFFTNIFTKTPITRSFFNIFSIRFFQCILEVLVHLYWRAKVFYDPSGRRVVNNFSTPIKMHKNL